MSGRHPELLVVGAGPTGLTLAHSLVSHGHAVRIVDRAPEPARHSGALVVHSRTQELLENAGLREAIAARAIPVRGMRLHRDGRPLATIPFDRGRFPALSLPQQETEAILRSALAARGVEVEWGHEVTAIDQHAGSVAAVVSGRRTEHPYVVGCDGAHSSVRKLLGIPFSGESLVETLWMADAELDWDLAPDHAWQLLHRAGMLSAIPMPGGWWRLVTMPDGERSEPDGAFFADAIRRRLGREPRRLDVGWVSSFRVNCRLAAAFGRGNVLLAGDAAHIHSPIGGQGMNIGMLDGFALAQALDRALAGGGADVLEAYESERRPHARAVVRANARLTRLTQARNPLQRFAADRLLPRALSFAPLARRVGLRASGY